MAQFHIHPDGVVYVRTASGVYADTLVNFAIDSGTSLPTLPDGAVQALYDDDRHLLQLFDAKNNQLGVGQDGAWPFADTAIANIATLLTSQTQRTAPPPKPRSQPSVTGQAKRASTVAS